MWEGNGDNKGRLKIKCDNITSVRDSKKRSLKMKSQQSFRSLNRAICKHIAELNKEGLEIVMSHIKGHQDDIQRFESLTRWSQLNVIADNMAKKRLAQHFYSKEKVGKSRYHKEGWTCWVGNNKCEDFKHNQIQDWVFQKKARFYWNWREKLSLAQFDNIGWEIVEKALARKSHGFHTWFSKHHLGWCGIGRNIKKWGFWSTDKCPCCLTHS